MIAGMRRALVRVAAVWMTWAAAAGNALGAEGSWTNNLSGNWSASSNWAGTIPDAAGDAAWFTNNISVACTVTVNTNSRTLGILSIGDANATHSFTIAPSGGARLTFDNTPNSANAQLNQVSTSTNNTISVTNVLNSSLDISNASPYLLTIAGGITNAGADVKALSNVGIGSGGVTISGVIGTSVRVIQDSGTSPLTLSGANTYTGETVVASGTLRAGAANAIPGGTGRGNVLVNGTLDVNFADTINGLSGTGKVNNSSGTAAILTVGSNNQTCAFSGVITNTGAVASLALTKTGTGSLTLSGDNGYGGVTTVGVGVLNIQNGSALGATNGGTTVASGAALQLQGGITTLAEALTLNGAGMANDGALRSLSGINTFAGLVTLGATGVRINSDSGTLTLSHPGTITGSGFALTVGGTGNMTINSAIGTGTGTLTKDGSGTVTLTGTNTYTGVTTVSNGALLVEGSLGAGGGAITVMPGSVLGGTGVISRAVTIAAGTGGAIGGTLAPGGTNVGMLTVNGNFTLVPTNPAVQQPVWAVQLGAITNDLLVVNGSFIMANTGKVTLRIGNAGALPNNKTYPLLTWTNANPAGDAAQFEVVCLDPNWTNATVTVDTNAKKVLLGNLVDRIANVAATNVTDTTADLIGNLTATGSSPTTVWTFWGTNNCTTNKTWAHSTNFVATRLGLITHSIASLTPNQTNYFTYYASNTEGEVWAQPSLAFKAYGPLSVDNSGGATSIGYTIATLRGTLLNGNAAYASARWGTNADLAFATTSTPTWVTEGVFPVLVTGLVNNTTYYYQALVSNAYDTAASSITNFTTTPFLKGWYVAANGPAGGDGSSWEMAFTNLQTAIDAAATGDTIYLAGHTFSNSTTQLNSKYVWTNKPLTILGGYAADGGTPGSLTNRPTILTSSTIAVGSSTRILYIRGVTNGTLQRFTITGGTGFPSGSGGAMNGAGLYIAASSNLTIESCVISNNLGTSSQNSLTYGGGIYLVDSEVRLVRCDVIRNSAKPYQAECYGGGIHLASGSLMVSNCVIRGNEIGSVGGKARMGYGGAASIAGGALTMVNTLVASNKEMSSAPGGYSDGIYVGNGSASLVNCTVAYNYGSGIRYVAGTVALTNTIVWGHTVADVTNFPAVGWALQNVAHSLLGAPAEMHGFNGCITNDPLFVNTNSGDYRLQTMSKRWSAATSNWVHESRTSPAVDAGTNQGWMASATDLDGLPRLLPDMVVDMGAYEANPLLAVANVMATNVTATTADLIGNLTATGSSPTTVWAFWATNNFTTNKTWTHSTNFVASLGRITNSIAGLSPNQTNYFTYYASNTEGEAWAQPSLSFKTWGPLSADNDGGATRIGYTIATLRGTLPDGNAAYASVRWSTNADLTFATTSTPTWVTEGVFSVLVTGLANNTTYYYQSLVSNAYDTAAASITNFTTPLYTGLYVATNGPAGGDGSSWGMAFTTIASAFAVAKTGETIYVAGHTFSLTNELVWPTNNLTLLGGYAATNTAVGPGEYDSLKWPTIITRKPPYTTRLISILNTTNALIERVTFRGGNGGQIVSTYTGTGLYATNSYALIRHAVFENNGPPLLAGYAVGGGAYLAGGGLTFEHVVFANNTVSSVNSMWFANGAGVYIDSGTHRFRNILGVGGRLPYSTSRGSFLYVNAGTVTVENATVAHNSGVGNAALYRNAGSLQVANSILWDNDGGDYTGTITFSNCCSIGLTAGVNGNLNQDPLLQTPLFYLAPNSPCIAQGNRMIEAAGVTNRTSFTNGVLESSGTAVNLGYHFREGSMIDLELWVNPATGSDANSGTTAGSPLKTITRALTLAPRTRINLAAGNYTNGVEAFPLTIDGRTVQLIGTNRDTTVINSSGAGQPALALLNSLGDNRMEGVTLTTGNSSRGLTISNAVFTLSGCSIASNLAVQGAGLYASGAHGLIQDTVFRNNAGPVGTYNEIGGGACLLGGGLHFDRVLIVSNRVNGGGSGWSAYGGGVYIDSGTHRLRNTLVAGNSVVYSASTTLRGSGFYINDGTVVIENATLVANLVATAIYRGGGSVAVYNSILWNNATGDYTGTITFTNCCSTGLTAGVQGNLTNDPFFVNTSIGDYRLQTAFPRWSVSSNAWVHEARTSPCIDAGTNQAWMDSATDLDGLPRLLIGIGPAKRVDLGAYEAKPNRMGTQIQFR